MGNFKLKVNLTYKEAVSLVLGGKPNQYGMRRHDEYHAMTGRCTEYLTKLNAGEHI